MNIEKLNKEEIEVYSDRKFRSLLFQKIISGSKLLRRFLNGTSDIFLSHKPTTVVKVSEEEKYLRINREDILSNQFKEDLNWLLAIDPDKSLVDIKNDMIMFDGIASEPSEYIKELYDIITKDHKDRKTKEPSEVKEEIEEEIGETEESSSCSSGHGKSTSEKKATAKKIVEDLDKKATLIKDPSSSIENIDQEIGLTEPEIETALKQAEKYEDEGLDEPKYNYLDRPVLGISDLAYLNKLKNKLIKAFKGSKGKYASYSPSKRINTRKDIMDKDNIYTQYDISEGKYLHMNIIIDMSGSMNGDPVKYANSILYLFNELANDEYFKGDVIFTSDADPYKITLPISRVEALNFCGAHGGAEGFKDTVMAYKDELRNTNVICITDGHITDKPINHSMWEKLRIKSMGVYVNPDKSRLKSSKKLLAKYFHHGLAVPNLEEMLNLLIKIGLKGKK